MNWYIFYPSRAPRISIPREFTQMCVYSDSADNAFRELRKTLKGRDRGLYSDPSRYMKLNGQQTSKLLGKIEEEEGFPGRARKNVFRINSRFVLLLEAIQ